jgi:thiamine biosynthesis protein ThiS
VSLSGEDGLEQEIQVRLNGKPRVVPAGLTVRGLLESLELRPELVVVELNREILKRESYGSVPISSGDTVELVHFVGGG